MSVDDRLDSVRTTVLTGLDEDILDYCMSILEEDPGQDLETLREGVGEFLLSSSFCTEEACDGVCAEIHALLAAPSDGESKGDDDAGAAAEEEEEDSEEEIELLRAGGAMSVIEQGRRQEGKHDLTTEQMQNMLFFENKQVTNDFSHTMDDFLKANKKGGGARKEALAAKMKARDDARVMATVKRLEVSLEVSAARLPPRNAGRGPQDVNLANVSLASPTGTSLLEGANLTFAHGRKYGLIGRNGVGKSTLLREISSYELDGFPQHLRVLHVEQEISGSDRSALEVVVEADHERALLLKVEKQLVALSKAGGGEGDEGGEGKAVGDGEAAGEGVLAAAAVVTYRGEEISLTEVYEKLESIDARTAETRAHKILSGLQFSNEMMRKPTSDLSGGWRMRVALAAALFLEPDLLLLDEPTNHLDLHAVLWLEEFLCSYNATLIIVSHDRKFLNGVITDVLHFNHQRIETFKGDYDVFEKVYAENRRCASKAHEAAMEKIAHLQIFIDKFRSNAKRAALVQSRIKMVARMKAAMVEAPLDDPSFRFTFPEPEPVGMPVLAVQDLTFGYTPDKILFQKANFGVDLQSRIGILGANGVGKSTLLKLILGQLEPIDGYVQRNSKLRIANFTQHHVDQLNLRLSPIQHLQERYPGNSGLQAEEKLRSHLGQFGIVAEVATRAIATLSGGQKSRVAFADITWRVPHLIIMDEPTNHLDLETIEALGIAVKEYGGGVMIISHDQSFVSTACTEFWEVGNLKVERHRGTFNDYKKKIMKG